jgi:three-Cys-motif partner protein
MGRPAAAKKRSVGKVAPSKPRRIKAEELERRGQQRLAEKEFPIPPRKTKRDYLWKRSAIWTANKALLIERYLYAFVFVTHDGSYIDGFAGPQLDTANWAAKRVLESKPQWLKHFFLCELKPRSVHAIEQLKAAQPTVGKGKSARTIDIYPGDFNLTVHDVLKSFHLTEKEPTFCLLDQRTFECHWSTVKAIAAHKKTGNKIELFYFLACAWFVRALRATTVNTVRLDAWWGSQDWTRLTKMSDIERANAICRRMTDELGYKFAQPHPIYNRKNSGRVMYYMIHATDHELAPGLMVRAYNGAVEPPPEPQQLALMIEEVRGESG